jgi:Toprim domain
LERRAATCCAFEANSALTAASARIAKFHLGSLLDKLDAVGRTDAVAMPPGSASSTCKVRFMARGAASAFPRQSRCSASQRGRCCSACLLGRTERSSVGDLIPPNEVQRVIIFGDNDQGFAGQAAAYSLARRIAGDRWTVAVRIPDQPGRHWNDVHARAGRPPAP